MRRSAVLIVSRMAVMLLRRLSASDCGVRGWLPGDAVDDGGLVLRDTGVRKDCAVANEAVMPRVSKLLCCALALSCKYRTTTSLIFSIHFLTISST